MAAAKWRPVRSSWVSEQSHISELGVGWEVVVENDVNILLVLVVDAPPQHLLRFLNDCTLL